MTASLMETGLPPIISSGDVNYMAEPLLTSDEIQARVEQMGYELADRYSDCGEVHVLTVLNGAVHFASDLSRAMQRANPNLDMTRDQVKVKSYSGTGSSGIVRFQTPPTIEVEGRHMLVVEDVYDTGRTLDWLMKYFSNQGAASIEVAVALDKDTPGRRSDLLGATVLHTGFNIGSEFVIGYGLDLDERYRDLEDIYKLQTIMPSQSN